MDRPGPGRGPGGRPSGHARRRALPPRRGGRGANLLSALVAGVFLVLSGVGLGTVGATLTGMGRLAQAQRFTDKAGPLATPASESSRRVPAHLPGHRRHSGPWSARAAPRAVLGVEAVDAEHGGALLVGVRVPGAGHTAGLVSGEVLLAVGDRRLCSAADLARAVAAVRPGTPVTLTVRRADGSVTHLTATPGVLT
ncbi:PDZ domain-containing protein [Streptomyces sp. NPDC052040]|uniref:PDZ domain-containing protein n=1 Tax=unclassified Streptomyces TaxID=2593676 RepID=UPI0037D7DFB1